MASIPSGRKLKKQVSERNSIPVEDIFAGAIRDIDNFDHACWNKGKGYSIPGFPTIENKLEGLEAGFYIFAGESNSGKSAIMMNMHYNISTHKENNLYGIYFSLDDSGEDITARIIARNRKIPISVCGKPKRWQEKVDETTENSGQWQSWLDERKLGLEELRGQNECFRIVDSTKVRNAEMLYDYMEKAQTFIRSECGDEANIIVAIDSLNDIRFDETKLKPGVETHNHIAKTVKSWAIDLGIVIFASAHLRKLNGAKRPSIDDLKESGEYVYEASLVWLVHNDVSKNKQAANIYYNMEHEDEKQPVIELDWGKNKKSSFKGRTYCMFITNQSLVEEFDAEAMSRYDALVYQT